MGSLIADKEAHFWSLVDVRSPDECWEWKAGKHSHGYGAFVPIVINGKREHRAHRIAFLFSGGEFTEDKPYGTHSCHNTSCCNPAHIRAGDQVDNMQDRKAAGRGNHPTGDRSGARTHPEKIKRGSQQTSSKLTEAQVLEIREVFQTTKISKSEIARRFGVSNPLIGMIIRREKWTHI